MKVYLVTNEWASEDACGTVIEVFADYDKAKETVSKWIAEEKANCWDKAFNENGDVLDGYEVDQGNDFWEI